MSLTPVNIMSGFKKCGIYPLNPGEVTDRQIAPSTVFVASNDALPVAKPGSIIERDSLYRKRYNEGYDIYDDDYLQWIRENKLELPTKASSSEVNSTCTSSSQPKESSLPVEASSVHSTHCGGSTASSLSEILVIPKPNGAPKKKRQAVNSKASCITDSPVLQELKRKKEEKEAKEEEKKAKKLEREKKKKEREKKKKEQEDKKKEREKKKEQDKNKKEQEKKKKEQEKKKQQYQKKKRQAPKRQAKARSKSASIESLIEGPLSNLDVNDHETDSHSDGDVSEAECPGCGLVYGSLDDSEKWIQCDVCEAWWDLTCACVEEKCIAEIRFVCDNCNS